MDDNNTNSPDTAEAENNDRKKTKQRHRRTGVRILKWTLLSLCGVVVVAGAGFGFALYALRSNPSGGSPSHMHSVVSNAVQHIGETVSGVTKPVNILLIANNARGASNPLSLGKAAGQADILIVAHVDPQKHTVSLISIPRDTLIAMPNWNVPIPKIKTTFMVGLQESPQKGPETAMKYVSQMTGLPIQDYIATDFQGFIDAIDAVGGISVDVKQRIYDPSHSGANLKPGVQTLNGQQALAFIRVRQNTAGNNYRTNDFQRQQAEVQVLEILKKKLMGSATNPTTLVRLANTWQKDVATNLSTNQLVGIGMEVSGSSVHKIQLGSDKDSMDLASTPAPGLNAENYLTGAYYDILDAHHITQQLAPFGAKTASLGLPDFPSPQTVPVDVYGSKQLATQLKQAGFPVTYMGSSGATRNAVYYPAGKMEWGWVVGRAVGNSNEWVAPSSSTTSRVVVYAP